MMMLHERLREWANAEERNEYPTNEAGKELGIGLVYSRGEEARLFLKLSDEIERTYIPLPIDVDGNPWQVGDECEAIISGKQGFVFGYSRRKIAVILSDASVDWYRPFEIKRIERDTLERINDDATKEPYAYCKERGVKIPDYAPEHEDIITAFVRDLLKRQRDVLERGE